MIFRQPPLFFDRVKVEVWWTQKHSLGINSRPPQDPQTANNLKTPKQQISKYFIEGVFTQFHAGICTCHPWIKNEHAILCATRWKDYILKEFVILLGFLLAQIFSLWRVALEIIFFLLFFNIPIFPVVLSKIFIFSLLFLICSS